MQIPLQLHVGDDIMFSSLIKCTQVIALKLRNDYIECEHNFANKGISYCEIHVHVILNVIT